MHWFLYNRTLRHERLKNIWSILKQYSLVQGIIWTPGEILSIKIFSRRSGIINGELGRFSRERIAGFCVVTHYSLGRPLGKKVRTSCTQQCHKNLRSQSIHQRYLTTWSICARCRYNIWNSAFTVFTKYWWHQEKLLNAAKRYKTVISKENSLYLFFVCQCYLESDLCK